MKKFILGAALLLAGAVQAQIQISSNNRFLRTVDDHPFFWLGDTDWELFHRLTREEAVEFINIRSDQGFNVLQADMYKFKNVDLSIFKY